jgi:serine phosphatase RsbU (regulator of sigma subunit)
MARVLQSGLAPDPIPDIGGFEIHAGYSAGGEGRLGGDWYDVFELPDGRFAVVVGDVAGSGVENVADMARVRHTVHAFLHDHGDPSRALSQTRDLVDAIGDDLYATVLAAVIDPGTGEMLCSRAGHVPPLLVDEGGARFVTEGASPPIGAPRSHPPQDTSLGLAPGALLLLVTDGVFESRLLDISEALERLRTRVTDLAPDPRRLAASLISLSGGTDDQTVVAIRRTENRLRPDPEG